MQTLFERGQQRAEASDPNSLPATEVPQVVKAVYHAIPSKQVRAFIKKEVKPGPGEKIIWIGQSSQVMHLVAFLLHLQIRNTIYVLTNDRLRVYSGIFSKHIEDVELFRAESIIISAYETCQVSDKNTLRQR